MLFAYSDLAASLVWASLARREERRLMAALDICFRLEDPG